jgi:hypothetical protein
MSRIVDTQRLALWGAVYRVELAKSVEKYPEDYRWPVSDVPSVAAKMQMAFERGSYNHDGKAIKATCRALGLKHTRKAIEGFITGG